MNNKIPIVHCWRDGTYSYNDQMDFDDTEMGAIVVGNREYLNELLEIRHLKGTTVTDCGELFHWIKDENDQWDAQHIGETTHERLIS